MEIEIRGLTSTDRHWATNVFREHWGSPRVVTRGQLHHVEQSHGFIALQNTKPVGILHYVLDDSSCEIISLISLKKGRGIGSKLLQTTIEMAKQSGIDRIWLITTNDNLEALGFYQRNGFQLCAIYPGAIDLSRDLKPEIPRIGQSGIPLRDEIELEWHGGMDRDKTYDK